MLHYIDTSLSHIINDSPLVIFPIQSVLNWINYGIYTEIYKVLPTVVYNAFIKRELNQKYRLEAIVFTFSLKQTHSMISLISLNNGFKKYKEWKKRNQFSLFILNTVAWEKISALEYKTREFPNQIKK